IAHHYTRYLGDLSGGQAIRTLMRRHYGLPKTSLTMWDFTEAGKTKPYKEAYRRRRGEVASTGGAEQIIIAAAVDAVRLTGELTDPRRPRRRGSVADAHAHENGRGAGVVVRASPPLLESERGVQAQRRGVGLIDLEVDDLRAATLGPVETGRQQCPPDALAACGLGRRDRHHIGFRTGCGHDDPSGQLPRRGRGVHGLTRPESRGRSG